MFYIRMCPNLDIFLYIILTYIYIYPSYKQAQQTATYDTKTKTADKKIVNSQTYIEFNYE